MAGGTLDDPYEDPIDLYESREASGYVREPVSRTERLRRRVEGELQRLKQAREDREEGEALKERARSFLDPDNPGRLAPIEIPEPDASMGAFREAEAKVREDAAGEQPLSLDAAEAKLTERLAELEQAEKQWAKRARETANLPPRFKSDIQERVKSIEIAQRELALERARLKEFDSKLAEHRIAQGAVKDAALLLMQVRPTGEIHSSGTDWVITNDQGQKITLGSFGDIPEDEDALAAATSEDVEGIRGADRAIGDRKVLALRRKMLNDLGALGYTADEKTFERPEVVARLYEWAAENAPAIAEAAEHVRARYGDTPPPTVLERAISVLSAPVLAVAGTGTLAAEGLGQLVGTPEGKMITDPAITGQSNILKRGEEFFKSFGETAAAQGWSPDQLLMKIPLEHAMYVPPLMPARLTAEMLNRQFDAGIGEGGKTSEAIASTTLELGMDPLWVVGWGAKGAGTFAKAARAGMQAEGGLRGTAVMKLTNEILSRPSMAAGAPFKYGLSPAGRALLPKYPKLGKVLLAPEKTWKWMSGKAKEALAFGHAGTEALHEMEVAFMREAGPEMRKIASEIREAEAETYTKLGLTPEQVAEVKNYATPVAEMSGQRRRMMIARMSEEDVVRQALVEVADLHDDAAGQLLVLEGKFGMSGKVLEDDALNYVMRRFSDEFMHFSHSKPDARKILIGSRKSVSDEQYRAAWQNFEKERKFRGKPVLEVEGELRKTFRANGLEVPDDMPIFARDPIEQLAQRARREIPEMTRRHLWGGLGTVMGKQIPNEPELQMLTAQAADARAAQVYDAAIRAGGTADEALETLEKFVAARPELRRAARQAGREAVSAPGAAQAAADIGTAPADLRASLRTEKDLRKMFPEAPQIADDAEAAMRAMADAVSLRASAGPTKGAGTVLSRDAQRRTNRATEKFYDAYQGATKTSEYRRAVRQYADELKQIVPPAMVTEFTKRADDALKQLERLAKVEDAVGGPVARAVRKRYREAQKKADTAAAKVETGHPSTWSPERKAQFAEAVLKRSIRNGDIPPPPTGHASALEIMRRNKVSLPDDIPSLVRHAGTFISPDDAARFERYMQNFHGLEKTAKSPKALREAGQNVVDMHKFWKAQAQRTILSNMPGAMLDVVHTLFTHAVFLAGVKPQWFQRAREAMGGSMAKWSKGPLSESAAGWKEGEELRWLLSEGLVRGGKGVEAKGGAAAVSDAAQEFGERGVAGTGMPGARAAGVVEQKGILGGAVHGLSRIPGLRRIPGVKRAGDLASEGVHRFTRWPLHARVYAEELSRVALFLQKRAEGLARSEAAEEVIMHFGRADEFTRFDRNIINNWTLFWTWRRNTIPITVRAILDKPVRERLILTAMNGDSDDPRVPEWARRMGGPMLGLDPSGNMKMWGLSGGTWSGPLFSALQSDMTAELKRGDIAAGLAELGKEGIRGLPPHLKGAVEQLTSYDYFIDRPWRDDSGRQQTRAPMAFHPFVTEDGNGKIETLLNLTPVEDRETGDLKYMTMDPTWHNFMNNFALLGPLAAWASSFTDPRSEDVAPGVSLEKGLAKTFGFPIHTVTPVEVEKAKVRDMRNALRQDMRRPQYRAITMTAYGDVAPDTSTQRGRELRRLLDLGEQRAKDMGIPGNQRERIRTIKAQVLQHAGYFDEWRLMEMGRRLKMLGDIADGGDGLQYQDFPSGDRLDKREHAWLKMRDRQVDRLKRRPMRATTIPGLRD